MKNFLSLLAIAILLISCRNDDETSNNLIGTWQAKSIYKVKVGTQVKEDATNEDRCALQDNYTFGENGIAEAKRYKMSSSPYESCDNYYSGSVRYSFDDKTLTLTTYEDGKERYKKITSLTNSELIFMTSRESYSSGTENYTYEYYTIFTKIK
ncbi:Uncharacterised protein [Chryseobacterium taklimakanense]|uniref:Lipocalin-like domain-containing protein n=1 Tax=Chryseobacterium taklimakanense TaxID=536441 RepID=A0A239X426_9FLAO|nr:lipocalin family protein [Chryseobacterium taklimakanense]SNV41447.1 Uncharacterised protein [Chryseobacterium taklimakanense]